MKYRSRGFPVRQRRKDVRSGSGGARTIASFRLRATASLIVDRGLRRMFDDGDQPLLVFFVAANHETWLHSFFKSEALAAAREQCQPRLTAISPAGYGPAGSG